MTGLARPCCPWDKTPPENRAYFDILGPGLVAVLLPRPPGGAGTGAWSPPTGGAWVHLSSDGRIRAFTGKAEVGQGTRAALTLIVAEELRVMPSEVELVMADTDLCPWDMGTFGSRSMPDAAPALARAAAGAREWLVELASERTGRPGAELEAVDGVVRPRAASQGLTYRELTQGPNRVRVVDAEQPTTPPSAWRHRVGS